MPNQERQSLYWNRSQYSCYVFLGCVESVRSSAFFSLFGYMMVNQPDLRGSVPYILWHVLTHWGHDKMASDFLTTNSNAFSWMKIYKCWLGFHLILFPRVQLIIFQHWFRWWLGADQATSHYLNQWWSTLLMHICITQPQWVNWFCNAGTRNMS